MYGGAAITTALAALGPFGILGGIATLGVVGLATEAISEFGFSAVFSGVVKQLYKQGERTVTPAVIVLFGNLPSLEHSSGLTPRAKHFMQAGGGLSVAYVDSRRNGVGRYGNR